MSYTRGSKVLIWAELTIEETGNPAQPTDFTDVVATVVDPVGTVTTLSLNAGELVGDPARPGYYSGEVDTTPAPGTWQYQFETTGANAIVERRQFTVKERLPLPVV